MSTKTNYWDARTFQVGEILEASFCYTARFPHFFEVTRNSGKCIWARELGKIVVEDDGYGQNGSVVPDKHNAIGEEVMGRIGKDGYVRLKGNYAFRWDGEPSLYYTD